MKQKVSHCTGLDANTNDLGAAIKLETFMIHRKHQHEYLDNTKKSDPAFALSLAPVKKLAPKEVYDIEAMILHMVPFIC